MWHGSQWKLFYMYYSVAKVQYDKGDIYGDNVYSQ